MMTGPEQDEPSFDGKPLREWVQELQGADAKARSRAAFALGRMAHPAVGPHLINALKDEEPFVRWTAAFSLSVIGAGAEAAVPALIGALGDPEDYVREQAYGAMVSIDPEKIPPGLALERALEDPSHAVRVQAARASWRRDGDTQAVLPILL